MMGPEARMVSQVLYVVRCEGVPRKDSREKQCLVHQETRALMGIKDYLELRGSYESPDQEVK